MKNKVESCRFCHIIKKSTPHWYDEILFETKHCCVVAALGPIAYGHYLIISKNHNPSFALCTNDEQKECREICEMISNMSAFKGMHPIEFEHGATGGECSGSCIVHAHMHIVFLGESTNGYLQMAGIVERIHDGFDDLAVSKTPYLYYADPLNRKATITLFRAIDVPRQALRKSVTEFSGVGEWDWEKNSNLKLLKKNISVFSKGKS